MQSLCQSYDNTLSDGPVTGGGYREWEAQKTHTYNALQELFI